MWSARCTRAIAIFMMSARALTACDAMRSAHCAPRSRTRHSVMSGATKECMSIPARAEVLVSRRTCAPDVPLEVLVDELCAFHAASAPPCMPSRIVTIRSSLAPHRAAPRDRRSPPRESRGCGRRWMSAPELNSIKERRILDTWAHAKSICELSAATRTRLGIRTNARRMRRRAVSIGCLRFGSRRESGRRLYVFSRSCGLAGLRVDNRQVPRVRRTSFDLAIRGPCVTDARRAAPRAVALVEQPVPCGAARELSS